MKKKLVVLSMILVLVLSVVGCSKKNKEETKEQTNNNASATEEVVDSGDDKSETEEVADKVKVSVASLKGPTSMGLVKMMKENEANNIKNEYDWNMYTAADEIVPKVVKGEVDIALIPANLAAVLYQKTNQGISVIDVNTLGVLNVLEHGNEIQSISDLKGKTICMTGKATVPEYTLKYLLSANGLSENDVTIEFKAEAPEVIAYMSTDDSVVGILPQPFVTSALLQDEGLRIACSLTEEWDAVVADAIAPVPIPASLEKIPLEKLSDDFIFDNQMLALILYNGYKIGEISCPTKYFKEASSINFVRSCKYGLEVLLVSLKYRLAKIGCGIKLFNKAGKALDVEKEMEYYHKK